MADWFLKTSRPLQSVMEKIVQAVLWKSIDK